MLWSEVANGGRVDKSLKVFGRFESTKSRVWSLCVGTLTSWKRSHLSKVGKKWGHCWKPIKTCFLVANIMLQKEFLHSTAGIKFSNFQDLEFFSHFFIFRGMPQNRHISAKTLWNLIKFLKKCSTPFKLRY